MNYMKYDTGAAGAENWIIEETIFDSAYLGKCESIFCQGNGYLGQRAALEERYADETRGLFVTGTFDRFSEDDVTELPNLPDMTALKLTLNGERFSMETGKLISYSRRLDLRDGSLTRELTWQSPKGFRYSFRFERFVSMANEHIAAFRMEIVPLDCDAELSLESGIDGRVCNTGTQHFLEGTKRLYEGRLLENCSKTAQSGVTCCQHMSHRFFMDGAELFKTPLPVIDRRYLAVGLKTTIKTDCAFVMEKICTVHTSRDLDYDGDERVAELAKRDGMELLRKADSQGFGALREQSATAWQKLWDEMDIKIDSENGYHQLAVRFALYHLNIMAKKNDNRVGIGAKALSGEGYKGHSFWDTEMFILPYFTLTQPHAARTLLEYRWRGLYGARLKAKENGFSGAMYPWESAWIDDGEVTPLWGAADVVTGKRMKILTGILEHHITSDIAFAVWQYYQTSGDDDFMRRCGCEIIIDTARFWASRCEWSEADSRYEILGVIGPDEYKEHIDNNAYTNYLAAYNMRLALKLMENLPQTDAETFARLDAMFDFAKSRADIEKVLEKLYLPKPDKDGVIEQFEGYMGLERINLAPYKASGVVGTIYNDYNMEQMNRIQVVKQADLLMLFFLLEDLFDGKVKRKNYKYYEEITLHDSSLSKNTHCVLACDLGLDDAAESFFSGACNVDLGPVMTTSNMGIHGAAMGGIWQCAVYGFGGVRIVDGKLRVSPRLHKEWKSLDFPLVWQGMPLQINATPAKVAVKNLGNTPVELSIYGDAVAIDAGGEFKTEVRT